VVAGDSPDREFTAQVVSALKALYDFPALFRHPLGKVLAPLPMSAERRGGFLRTSLMEAIAGVSAEGHTPASAAPLRQQRALRLRYVEGRTVAEVARGLAVSERQAHRDIRHGERCVASILWARRPSAGSQAAERQRLLGDALAEEVERLPLSPASLPLQSVLDEAVETLAPLLAQESTVLQVDLPPGTAVRSDAVALPQCVVAMLSYAIQCGGPIAVTAERQGAATCLRAQCRGDRDADPDALGQLLSTARTLAEAIGATLSVRHVEGKKQLRLSMPSAVPRPLLVVDDNAGLLDLFERYLSLTDLYVVRASDPEEGYRLACEAAPAAVVLDILMPGGDGWSLLRRLKQNALTAAVPVIVCSVFNDPLLAQALGAAAFVAKPVSQTGLLGALAALHLT
jgi:CheY-like chemotaxis protein